MELEELRRRLGRPKNIPSSSAGTESVQREELRSATPASPEPSSPKMNQPPKNSDPRPVFTEPPRNSAAAVKPSGDEMKPGEATLQEAREILSISEPLDAKPKLVEAVDKVFRPIERFREHFTRLARLFEPIGEASQSTLDAFTQIGDLQDHLVELCKTFQLVEAFTDQMGKVAETFDPMKPLHEQLMQLNEAFCANVLDLAHALEPVDALKARAAQLFEALDSIGELQTKLKEVARGLRPSNGGAQRRLAS